MVITVKHHVCCYCGGCVSLCPHEALLLNETLLNVDHARCVRCGLCEKVCPTGAIDIVHA